MADVCKVTIEKDGYTMTFEGSREFVDAQLDKFVTIPSKPQGNNEDNITYKDVSMSSLVQLKQPKGHHQIAAVLAFGLSEQGIQEFSEADIRRAYIQAGIRPPKVVAQALRDAKNNFDYIEGGSKRGLYRLSHHGDRTVRFDLPSRQG